MLQLDELMETLKVENAELTERKQELQRQVERHSKFLDFMKRVLKMTKVGYCEEFYMAEKHVTDSVFQQL